MDDRLPAMIVGVLFGIVNAVVTIYLALKVGMADGIPILLLFLSAFIFAITRSGTPRAFVYVMAIMTSSIATVVAYTDGFGAILISREPFLIPDYAMMALLGASGIVGILMCYYFMNYFLKGGFPWPMSRVMASIISVLAAEKKEAQFKAASLRMGAGGVLAGAVSFLRGLGVIPETIGSAVAGVGVSPLMIGIGMLVGFNACLQIALGALISLAILLFLEGTGTDYAAHMRSPWVFSTAISMMVTTAFITLYVIAKPFVAEQWGRLRKSPVARATAARDGGLSSRFGVRSRDALLLVILAIGAAGMQLFVGVPAWIFLVCVPIAVLFQVIESRGRAETSMSVGVSSFVVILLVGLAFSDIVPLLILEGFVLAMVLSFSLALSMFKIAEYSNVSTKGLAQMLAIGSVTGGIICIPIIRLLDSVYGIGTDALPAPYSVMWLEMARSAVTRVASPSISFYLIVAGVIIALVLYRYKVSAVSVALGLILPVSVSATLLLGGIVAWYITRKGFMKDDKGITASGLIAGDILVGLALSLRSLI